MRRHKGWLTASVEKKINSHIQLVKNVCEILTITKIVVETASFDIWKIKNPDIEGKKYQQGEQTGIWNVREYVLSETVMKELLYKEISRIAQEACHNCRAE